MNEKKQPEVKIEDVSVPNSSRERSIKPRGIAKSARRSRLVLTNQTVHEGHNCLLCVRRSGQVMATCSWSARAKTYARVLNPRHKAFLRNHHRIRAEFDKYGLGLEQFCN